MDDVKGSTYDKRSIETICDKEGQNSIEHEEVEKHKCHICNKEFGQYELEVHFLTCSREYKCDLCEEIFAIDKNLKKHITNVHNVQKNHKCDTCDKSFSQSGVLKIHIKCVHEGLKNHKCDLCDKAFSQKQTLVNHIKSVHKGLKNHKCDICM